MLIEHRADTSKLPFEFLYLHTHYKVYNFGNDRIHQAVILGKQVDGEIEVAPCRQVTYG